MENENSLNDIIDRFIKSDDFPYQIDEKWKQNANHRDLIVGDVLTILTESEMITTTPSPTEPDDVNSTFPGPVFTRTGDPFIEDFEPQSNIGQLTLTEALLIVVGVAAGLAVVLCCVCKYYRNNRKPQYAADDDPFTEGKSDNENDNDNETQNVLEQHGHSESKRLLFENMNQQRENREQMRRIDPNVDEVESALPHAVQEEEEKVPTKQHHIVEVNENEVEDSLQKLLSMNGYAEFEDSDIRDSQIALPLSPGGTLQNGYHTAQDSREWAFQKGPVISQIQTKKVKYTYKKGVCVVFCFVSISF